MGEERDKVDVDSLYRQKNTRYFVLSKSQQLIKNLHPFDALFTPEEIIILGGQLEEAYLLGFDENNAAFFALSVPQRDKYPDNIQAIDLRAITRSGLLKHEDLGAIAQARSLVLWHQSHCFCSNCGKKTKVIDAGYARFCPSCERRHFPRTDPVAIMLVIDKKGRCLLGRSASFPENMLSALAGFVEVGETVEEAVKRELFEEAGIKADKVLYHSSQPWPFPSSLMMGFYAQAATTDIKLNDELEFCHWFTKQETRQILENTHPKGFKPPSKMAIARQLMVGFVENY